MNLVGLWHVCAGVDGDAARSGRQSRVRIWAWAAAVAVAAIGILPAVDDAPVPHIAAAGSESSRTPQLSAGNGGLAW
jgi:hypothetical protein